MSQQTAFPVVMCPGCQVPVNAAVTEALPNSQHKTTYRCEKCGTETDRNDKHGDK